MEALNIISGMVVLMLALPQITFNRKRAWLWISFLVISGFFIVTTVAHLLLSLTIGIYDCESNPDLFLRIIIISSPTVAIMRKTADTLAGNLPENRPVKYCWPLLPARNILFILVVFGHIFLRLMPGRVGK